MSKLVNRLDVHFAALAAVGAIAGVGTAQKAEAAVVYSGVVNLVITNNIDGIYLNLVSGANGTSSGAAPGFDINPYVSGGLFWNMFEGTGCTEIGVGSTFTALTAGTPIDGSGAYINGSIYPVDFATTAILGVKFIGDDAATHFGWVRLTLPGTPGSAPANGTIVDWAYDSTPNTGINAGVVPAPTAGMAVLAMGGLGLLGRRRKN